MRLFAAFAFALALLGSPGAAQSSAPPKRVALMIGEEGRDELFARLPNVKNDVLLLTKVFESIGFTVQPVNNPTAGELRERLRQFEVAARNAEIAVVYFGGHGIQVDGIDYFATADAKYDTVKPQDLEAVGFVSVKDLVVSVQSASQFSMVFAEAGRTDPWKAESRGLNIAKKITASEAASDASVLIFYGSQPGSASMDGLHGQNNGVFATAVAKHLIEPGLEIGLFVRRVRAEVSRATNREQRPELYGELGEREFYFAGSAPQPALPAVPVFSSQPRLALVVGNSDYNRDGDLDDGYQSAAVLEGGFPTDLANPINDSTDIKVALEKLRFDVTLVQNVDRAKLADALFKFEEKINAAPDNAIVVIYYAGHAIQVGGGNYLLPVGARLPDADLERLPPAQAELLISAEALPVQTSLLERLRDPKRDGLNLVILDACRENPWGNLVVTRSAGGRAASAGEGRFRGLGEVRIDLRRTAIAYATKPGDVAADGTGRNSPYTAALVKLLPLPGVSVLDLLDRVNGEVEAATDGRQVPWVNSPAIGKTCLGACVPRD